LSRIVTIVISVLLLIALAVGGWFFFTDNAQITEDVQDNTEQLEASQPSEIVFRMDPEQSQAEFNIDEVLRGEDFTVVGVTNQIAGDIRVNRDNPAESTVGEIRINARDLTTDASNRNRALRQVILRSSDDAYEFITFQPTSLTNMPESVTVGEPFEFQIVGDLTIIDVTNEVTFDATVTPLSETEIEGTAETVIMYPDWSLTIPSVPFVASVDEDVLLRLSFVAIEASQAPDTTEPEATEEAGA
jgi:polyisoprenoid-binding protein YceI